jgi:hypothetical protein
MPKINMPLEGGCRCGKTRLKITATPLVAAACHCKGCQKMSSSAYSLGILVPADGFQVTQGEPVLGGLRGEITQHNFCPHCMTWMYTGHTNMESMVVVRATMMDDISWFTPFMETYTDDKLPFATTSAKHSFPTFPGWEAMESLTKEYKQTLDN